MLIKGSQLNPRQRALVLAAFVHRHLDTTSKSDQEWLDKHAFEFIRDGSRLSGRHKYCVPVYMADDINKGGR